MHHLAGGRQVRHGQGAGRGVTVVVAVVDVVPPRPATSPEGVVEGVAAVVVLREGVAAGEQEDSDLQGKTNGENKC